MWFAPREYQCVILDGAVPGIKELWYRHSHYADTTVHLYSRTAYASMMEISPLMAQTNQSDPFWAALYTAVESGDVKSNWGCLACTAASPALLAKHFCKWITIYDDIGAEVFFRFYDPDILPHFISGLRGDERQWFFGPVDAFLYREEARDVLTVSTAGRLPDFSLEAALANMPPAAPWFNLEERHIRAMRSVFWPILTRNVFNALLPHIHMYLRQCSPQAMYAKIEECLQSLAKMQNVCLPEQEDGVRFCLIAISSCSHFFCSPEFLQCVDRHGMHAALDEWKQLAHEEIPSLEQWHDPAWLTAPALDN